jgi:hypothetical protein
MTNEVRPGEVIELMRTANPVSASDVRKTIKPDELEDALLSAIETDEFTSATSEPSRVSTPLRRRALRRSRLPTTPLGVGLGLACVVAIAGTVLLSGGSVGGGDYPEFAAAAVRVAEENPRLLVTAPGWSVVRANEFAPDEGEMTFSDGTDRLDMTWYPARSYESYRRDRAADGRTETSTLNGQTVITVDYGEDDYATMLPPEGPVWVEIRGRLGSRQAYEDVLDSIRAVDVNTWLSAMPASVVKPEQRAAAVDEMLEGIPIPPGFDVEALADEGLSSDRYQLGAHVTSAIACGWLERWAAATDAGDQDTADASVAAMATSRKWPILQEMANQGGYSEVFWEMARQLQDGELDAHGVAGTMTINGVTYEEGPPWAVGFGCDSAFHRRVND